MFAGLISGGGAVASFVPFRISASGTNVVKSGPGVLHSITINTATAGTITIYDNVAGSGTVIATITVTAAVTVTLTYDAVFALGLTVVSSANTDFTVSYN
jgi:hypothetical protein